MSKELRVLNIEEVEQDRETNHKCKHYNWGRGYPKEYGARCEKFDKFFSQDETGKIEPNCKECRRG